MSALVHLAIDPSQFPGAMWRELLDCLRRREVNSKFHYESVRQVQKWLALHEAYSPFRTKSSVAGIYEAAAAETARRISGQRVHVAGLACGGGKKDSLLLKALARTGRRLSYCSCDASLGMSLVARETAVASGALSPEDCFPLVCDLAGAEDLRAALTQGVGVDASAATPAGVPGMPPMVITFFGALHNFDPDKILRRLSQVVSPLDHLLLSANLCLDTEYRANLREILPLYDNALTRDWLMCFLSDLDVQPRDGRIEFCVEPTPGHADIARVVADFRFERDRTVRCGAEAFRFRAGERIRLFFSCRFTPAQVANLLAQQGMQVDAEWIAEGGEEGVFLVRRLAPSQ